MENWLDDVKPLWRSILEDEMTKEYFLNIKKLVSTTAVYPQTSNIFRAFSYFDIEDTKVVILGQDPYHEEGQAMGLSFSVPIGVKIPPSLRNIYKEIDRSIGYSNGVPKHGSLEKWAQQGVLLLNSALTVTPRKAGSHRKLWCQFTDAIIGAVSKRTSNVVFLLWGKDAEEKRKLVDWQEHCILISSHPSPLSARRGFLGCNHFNLANDWLEKQNRKPINWTDNWLQE